MLRMLRIILLISLTVNAQQYNLTEEIGSFSSAVCFDINAAGYIYVCDSESNEIYKLSPKGKVVKSVGGYGWQAEAFDYPVDIFASTLNVYISDYNNHRIQMFDKDLNFLSEFKATNSNDSYSFAYPKSCSISNQGDMFILDGDNQRILKYDINGNFMSEIGNTDAGEYALNEPNNLAISNFPKLFVTDKNFIKVFDVFGNGLTIMNPNLENPKVAINGSILTVNDKHQIKFINLSRKSNDFQIFAPQNLGEDIEEAIVIDNVIYILTPQKIYKYEHQ